MSNKWYCEKLSDFSSAEENAMEHIQNGTIVSFADDIDTFAEEMEINKDDIEMV